MKDELRVFENRSDDWLAKERQYEESVSVWDFDEGYKIKKEHEQNCEVRQIKETHERKHKEYDALKRKRNNDDFKDLDGKNTGGVLKIIFIIVVLTTLINIVGNTEELGFAIPIIIFIILVNLFNGKRRK